MKHSKALLVALAFCIGALVGALFVQAQTSLSIQYLMGGIYPGAPDYTIWKEGSSYLAKDTNGQIDFSGTNATTVINNAFSSAPIGGKILFEVAKYSISGILTPKDDQMLEGQSRGKHNDFASSTILEFTTASATLNLSTIEGIRINHLTIQGSNIARGIITGDSSTLKSANYLFTDVTVRNCTYGIYNDDTVGFYDSAFYSCIFLYNEVAVQLKELMNTFYQCVFGKNEVAVEYGVSTTGHWASFESGCVFSGNDYDFNFTSANPSLTVRNAWFESEGLYTLGMGNGNLFTNTTGLDTGTNGLVFERCYFSEYTNIDLRFVDYGGHGMRLVVFQQCNFQGQNNLTFITVRSASYYPHFINSWRLNTTGNKLPLISHASGANSIADGGTINHNIFSTPTMVVVSTSISNEFASVTAIGATTFTVAIKQDDGSPGTTQTIYWIAEYDP